MTLQPGRFTWLVLYSILFIALRFHDPERHECLVSGCADAAWTWCLWGAPRAHGAYQSASSPVHATGLRRAGGKI